MSTACRPIRAGTNAKENHEVSVVMTTARNAAEGHLDHTLARMTDDQAAHLRLLARQAYEPDAFKPGLGRAEAARRIAALEAKLRLLDEPPHTL
jgi:hypothetical protein